MIGISIDGNNKRYLLNQIKWFGIYVVAGFFFSILLPFPISLVVYLGVFLILNFVRTRLRVKKMGISFKSLFKQPSSVISGGSTTVKFYCMSCGKEHKEIACPKCGSKMKRVD
ncbi:MAG: hypothetical protein ACRD8W_16375 [Nitrososphaeraceae archaeon]